ncbi:MAG: glycoside hydrolase family 30 protein [Bacteroidales bacterium]
MKRVFFIFLLITTIIGNLSAQVMVSTTAKDRWQVKKIKPIKNTQANVDLTINSNNLLQEVSGFGGAFNELGWDALQSVSQKQRDEIFNNLYSKDGCAFSISRTPIGSSDYSFAYYSYDDVKDDYTMRNFSIARDRYITIPYIKEALKRRPDLKIWASPWSPPAWMKINEHYSLRSLGTTNGEGHNKLDPRKELASNTATAFNMMTGYLQAYALYFSKYVQAYKENGVNIDMVMPQNEIAYRPAWPCCTWRPEDLAIFVGEYLGPQFEKDSINTQIWLGTINYSHPEYIRTFLKQKNIDKYVKGIGVQWSGMKALPVIHKEYPNYRYMQTENQCGDGENNWTSLEKSWNSMVHCFNNGVNSYMYWNMVLDQTGKSAWGWPQNSLVIINRDSKEVKYTDEFYLMKHFSHFLQPGSYLLKVAHGENYLVFKNAEGKVIVEIYNNENNEKDFNINVDGKIYNITLKAKSINTVCI